MKSTKKDEFPIIDVEKDSDVQISQASETLNHLTRLRLQKIEWDPNLPEEIEQELEEAIETDDDQKRIQIVEEFVQNSPYPEVRAAVLNFDDHSYSYAIRAWTLGFVFTTFGAAANMLLSMRNPYIVINTFVVQVVSFPIGKAWAKWMPEGKFKIGSRDYYFNPGPFSKKEHCLIVIMTNAAWGGGAAYATDILLAQKAFYHQNFGYTFDILLCISNMMMGFGIAGFFNRFLVQPGAMIWPGNLINTVLFTTLHDHPKPDPTKTSGWKIDKYRLFTYTMIGSFCWYWFPGCIAPFLSIFAWITWIKPQDPIVNQLFGGATGISLLPMTFDWTQISGFNFSPLIAPWHAIGNTLIGLVVWFLILAPIMSFTNFGYADYLPISDSGAYDNMAKPYNVSRILDPISFTFVVEKYRAYSPIFLSTTFTLCYALGFASVSSVLTHTILFHGKDVWVRLKKFNEIEEDVHAKIMANYKQVPLWWYGIVFLSTFGIGLGISIGYQTHLSWWAFCLSICVGTIFFLPIGIVAGTTNIWIGLSVLTEVTSGYVQPGKPLAMMMFKAYGYMALYQGLAFINDQKLAHYMHLPPRITFIGQILATAWSGVVEVGVMHWALGSIKNVCQLNQENHYSCPNGRVFFTTSILWGAIGPQRIFSKGGIYDKIPLFFLIGIIVPIIIFFAAKRWPKSSIKFLSAPIFFGGTGLIPPATPLNYLSWGIVGFVFNKWIRNRHRGWWMHYNYVLSAGLDVGLALCTITIFCSLQLTGKSFPSWWGNTFPQSTMDLTDTAIRKHVAEGEIFGPQKWL